MNLASVIRSEQKLLLPTYDRQKVLFTRGRGVYLWDSQGKRYLDFLSGIGVNALGYGHPAIRSTLKRQADQLIHVSNLFFHQYQAELAKQLTKISGLEKAFFCNSGTEAWEGALKLARAYARTQNHNGHKAKWRLLILDEIQCGLGRTGRYFAYQHYGVNPDIVTVAKPLAAGLPLGAILTTDRVASGMHPGMHGTTFGGGPLACAVSIEFLRTLDGLLDHVREMGDYLRTRLDQLKARHTAIREVRGMGLMLGTDLNSVETAKAVVAQLLQQGILINCTNETVLRFLPPYIIQKKHVDEVIRALDAALTRVPQHKSTLERFPKRSRTH